MNGFIIINKPASLTSHDVVDRLRKLTSVKQIGHAGTLDPFATGVLIVAIGNTTRLFEYTKSWSKTYEAEITLGATSDTDDVTGTITPHPRPFSSLEEKGSPLLKRGEVGAPPGEEEIRKTLTSFLGPILQVPPTYAAIKVKGKKLYEYARIGETAVRKPRPVTIHSIKLLSYEYPFLKLEIHCGPGTYIRALGRDIGEKLGTGAYVSRLERKSIHTFHISQSLSLSKLSTTSLTSSLLPPERLIEHLPQITLSLDNVAKFKQGQAIALTAAQSREARDSERSGIVSVFDEFHHLLGIGRFDPATSLLHPQKVL